MRLSYTQNGSGTEFIEENNFYPFGMKHEGYNALAGNPSYNYGYNGKELQKETGWSDYGARMYMSDIGRWGVIDPLAETTRRMSPYNYAMNNPVMFIDPDGRKAYVPMERTEGAQSSMAEYFRDGHISSAEMSLADWAGGIPTIFTPDAGGGSPVTTQGNPSDNGDGLWKGIGKFFKRLFGSGKKSSSNLEVGPVKQISEKDAKTDITWSLIFGGLFGSVDPYSAIGNAGVGPYAEERETAGMAAMIFINPEAAAEGLERKALSKAAMSKIWGAGPLRIDPQNLPKNVTEDMVEILAGRGNPIIRNGAQETVRHNAKWAGALEWKIKDVPGTTLNGSRIVQHPDGRWGLVTNHDYTKIIQIPTSSAVKWK